MRYLFILALLLTIGTLTPASAQQHAGYCDGVKTTAETQDCVHRHLQDEQEKLNTVYKSVLESHNGDTEKTELLGKAQQSWLTYRDAQCAWEAGIADNPALERINELSCLTLLTSIRSDLLSLLTAQENEDGPREYGAQPRWMNVLAQDYPDVFWRYGKWIHADLDCDGEKEQVMTGLATNKEKNKPLNVVVSITENPATGRPKTELLYIPVLGPEPESVKDPYLCAEQVDFALVSSSVPEEQDLENNVKPKSCDTALQIIDRQCKPVLIQWKEETYKALTQNGGTE